MTDHKPMPDTKNTQPAPTDASPRPLPVLAKWLTLVPSAVAVPTAAGAVVLSLIYLSKPVWGLFAFEVAMFVAACFGVLLGLGKFRSGWALGSLCIAGAFAANALFGWYLDARSILDAAIGAGDAPAWSLDTANISLAVRAGSAGLCALAATVSALGLRPRAWGRVALAAAFFLPLAAVAAFVKFANGMDHITTPTTGFLEIVRIVGTVIGGLLLVICASVSGHFAIRAFESALPEELAARKPDTAAA